MTFRRLLRDEEGATLAVTAVIIAAVMAIAGARHRRGNAPGGARRGAAGGRRGGAGRCGGSYLTYPPPTQRSRPSHDTAMSFARQNLIRDVPIDSAEVTIQVIPTQQKVWVRIERTGLSLWFAKLLGPIAR